MNKNKIRNLKITRNIYAVGTALAPVSGFLLINMPKDISEYVSYNLPILQTLPPMLKDASILASVGITMAYSAYNTYQTNRDLKVAKKR